MENTLTFLIDFKGNFGSILTPLPLKISLKIIPDTKKVVFQKSARRLSESSIFEGRDLQNPSKRPPEVDPKIDAFGDRKNLGLSLIHI